VANAAIIKAMPFSDDPPSLMLKRWEKVDFNDFICKFSIRMQNEQILFEDETLLISTGAIVYAHELAPSTFIRSNYVTERVRIPVNEILKYEIRYEEIKAVNPSSNKTEVFARQAYLIIIRSGAIFGLLSKEDKICLSQDKTGFGMHSIEDMQFLDLSKKREQLVINALNRVLSHS
jgi:hypothetical protein